MSAAAIDFSDLGGKRVEAGASPDTIDFSDLGGKVVQQSSVASRPGVPRPSAPQLSPSEDMPLSQAAEDSKGNVGQTLRELGGPAAFGLAVGGGPAALAPELQFGAGYAAAATSAAAKKSVAWISANPIKAYLLFKGASELGVHPLKWLHLTAGVEPEP